MINYRQLSSTPFLVTPVVVNAPESLMKVMTGSADDKSRQNSETVCF